VGKNKSKERAKELLNEFMSHKEGQKYFWLLTSLVNIQNSELKPEFIEELINKIYPDTKVDALPIHFSDGGKEEHYIFSKSEKATKFKELVQNSGEKCHSLYDDWDMMRTYFEIIIDENRYLYEKFLEHKENGEFPLYLHKDFGEHFYKIEITGSFGKHVCQGEKRRDLVGFIYGIFIDLYLTDKEFLENCLFICQHEECKRFFLHDTKVKYCPPPMKCRTQASNKVTNARMILDRKYNPQDYM